MRTLIGLTALAVLCSPLALAGEKVDKSLSVANPGGVRVIVEHMNGEADIRGWDKAEVKVTGELSDRAEEFIFEQRGNEVLIKVEMPRKSYSDWDKDEGDDLEIWLPRQGQLDYESINADVLIEKVSGDVDVTTVNGDIRLLHLPGRLRVDSVNGEVEARGLSGDIRIETVNGDIEESGNTAEEIRYTVVNGDMELETTARRVHVSSVNGDMELNLQQVDSLTIDTVGGDVDATLALSERARVEGSTVSGDIRLTLPKDTQASFSLEGHAGGDLRNNLSADKVKRDKYGPGRRLEFTTGSGAARVEMSTISGRLGLEKQ
ncbi:hypothetical protein HMF8227_02177 [Saliniradius amylolyticus]|uniref:DUF4097 domain-containing protein n=2 Tax=Saliniradius amylolyticus TaxID=2183582 RepID=A0A2S2E4R3_9ALTE|nr:hypothetical protein HMF8227_02177 [Saliniradius amylolyticus]